MRLRSSQSAPQVPSPSGSENKVVPSKRKLGGHEVIPRTAQSSAANIVPQPGTPQDGGASATGSTPITTPNPSSPRPLPSSSKDPALSVLEKLFTTLLPPEDYNVYEKIMSDLGCVKDEELKRRASHHAALRDLFARHPKAVHVHNKFASSYNKRNEERGERFRLPVFEFLGAGSTRLERLNSEYASQAHKQWPGLSGAASRGTIARAEVGFAMQYDGAMDIEPGLLTQTERTLSIAPHLTGVNSHDMDVDNQDIEPASPHLVDVDMEEPDEAAVQGRLTEGEMLSNANAGKESVDADHTAVTPSDPGGAEQKSDRELEPPLPSQGNLQPASVTEVRQENRSPRALTSVPTERKDKAAETISTVLTEGEMMAVDSEENNTGSEERDKERSPNPTHPFGRRPKFGSTEEYRLREERSVESYLAWLQHRQTRFPTAPPNSSEAILIAQKLSRPAAIVYEDILYRWGFETNSQCGAWYKQNRLTVLGEDPRFDEETMGTWEAWVKEGRDLMAGRESR